MQARLGAYHKYGVLSGTSFALNIRLGWRLLTVTSAKIYKNHYDRKKSFMSHVSACVLCICNDTVSGFISVTAAATKRKRCPNFIQKIRNFFRNIFLKIGHGNIETFRAKYYKTFYRLFISKLECLTLTSLSTQV